MTARASIDVQGFLNEHPYSPFQWLIFTICFLIVLFDGFDTAAIGFVAPSLIKEWGMAKPALAPVLSAALLGLAGGAFAAGPLADRFGRKGLLVASVAVFGVACAACSLAADIVQLTVLRFVTGFGLGAAMPNAVTLMSEYCPDKRRATLTNTMFCGFPLGAAFGGFLAAWMIPLWGWRSVFLLGGIAPLVLVAVMIFVLPESVRYMVHKGVPAERVRATLRRISAAADRAQSFSMTERAAATAAKGGVGVVLGRQYILGSAMLWTAYFMGLVIFYSLINWMPILFKDAGLDAKTATLIAALFPLGGIGAVLFGWLMDRINATRVVAVGFALTAAFIYAIGQVLGNSVGLLVLVVLVAGALMNMSQSSLPSLAAAFYPTKGRATGVAWMMGIGRFGGIAGSFLVAELTRRQLGLSEIFAVMALPGLLAAMALAIKLAAYRGREAATPAVPGTQVLGH
jgi:AAHS family 4-hydroxybenzoate transporter-like MFS transporter